VRRGLLNDRLHAVFVRVAQNLYRYSAHKCRSSERY
jgi:hypothetical protein